MKNSKRTTSLQWRITAGILVVVLSVLLLLLIHHVNQIRVADTYQLKKKAALISDTLNHALNLFSLNNRAGEIQRLVENVGIQEDVDRIILVDKHGTVIADSRRFWHQSILPPRMLDLLKTSMQRGEMLQEVSFEGNSESYIVVRPLHGLIYDPKTRNNIAGGVIVLMDLKPTYARIRQTTLLEFAIYTAGTLILTGMILIMLRRHVTGPILTLSRQISRYRAGNLDARSQLQQHNELGQLSDGINELGANLSRSLSELDASHSAMAAAESERRTHQVVEHAIDAFISIDPTGRITMFNHAAESMFGWKKDEVLHRLLTDCVIPERFHLAHSTGLKKFIATGKSAIMNKVIEVVACHRDGYEFPVEMTITPMQAGDHLQFNAFIRDITERKKSLEKLKQYQADLESINQRLVQNQAQLVQSEKMASLGQLAAGIAHEINNPLGYVLTNLSTLGNYWNSIQQTMHKQQNLLQHSCDPSCPPLRELEKFKTEKKLDYILSDVESLLSETQEGAGRVRDIVQNLKTFAHTEADEIKNASVNDAIEFALKLVWNELKYKCEVIKTYADMPEIPCYSGQLSQVFMNLLVNAAQSIQGQGQIRITTEHDDNEIRVRIADTGQGIPEEIIPKLFMPFFTTKPVGQGTGLGLSVSYGIIQRHGGHIEVQSTQGKGSEFVVHLPKKIPAVQQESA